MWKCPNCGREFKHENQQHFCGNKPSTIDEYIEQQDLEIRERLELVRKTIREALPDAQEKISWSMPTFWKKYNLIHFAAFKKHIGIYSGAEAMEVFADKLTDYKTSKGALQLPNNKELPLDLLKEIAAYCGRPQE